MKHFPAMVDVIKKITGAIPKGHISNHNHLCQYLWSLNYIRYCGETYGEMIEGSHSEQNGAAASTKEMNRGHRHDSLDAIVNYWNWSKFHMMGTFFTFSSKEWYSYLVYFSTGATLYRLYVRNIDSLKSREKCFIKFSACFETDLIQKWEAIDDRPRMEGKELHSVHQPKFEKCMFCLALWDALFLTDSFSKTDWSQSTWTTPGWRVC